MFFQGANRVPPARSIFVVMQPHVIEYHHFERVDSTNSLASNMLKDQNVLDWTVISTDTQTAGRGQQGTTWQDEPGKNVLMSLISPVISWPVSRIFELNMCVALAVSDVVNSYVDAGLKWPNDILIGEKKLGGMLLEPTIRGSWVNRLIIGLGINVHQNQWPEENIGATSLALHLDESPEVQDLIVSLAHGVSSGVNDIIRRGFHRRTDYLEQCLGYSTWRNYELVSGGLPRRCVAMMTDVAGNGALRLKTESGERLEVQMKEVRFVG